jgi:6-phosphogluconolactonase
MLDIIINQLERCKSHRQHSTEVPYATMDAGENMPTAWSRRTFVASAAATLATTKLRAATPDKSALVYIGSTTTKPGDGIHVARWNPAGTLSDLRVAAPMIAPNFLALSANGATRFLFAGGPTSKSSGALSAFSIQPSGDLTLINTLTIPDFDMVHTAVDHTGRVLVSVSYSTGKILTSKIAPDGRLSDPVTQIQLTGHGPNASRQTRPHAHGICFSPDNKFVLINDLGTDRIMVYKLNTTTAELTPNATPYFTSLPGAGPRHLAFHPNGKWAYSINELDSTLTQMSWDAATGTLKPLSSIPTLPPGYKIADNRAGEVLIDPAGRFLYSCNRGPAEDLVIYKIASDGHLVLITHTPLGGKEARHYALSPDSKHLVVARQFSNNVAVFARNKKTGVLTPTPAAYTVDAPSCILFA